MRSLDSLDTFSGDCLIFAVGNSIPECVENFNATHGPLLKAALNDAGFKGDVG